MRSISITLSLLFWTIITTAQTQNPLLLADIDTFPKGSNSQKFRAIGNTTFFVAESRAHGQELWKVDAITEEAVLVKDIAVGKEWSYISNMQVLNGVLYFSAYDNPNGKQQLWRSDGTTTGTYMVKEIGYIDNIVIHQNALYFQANTPTTGHELWRSDGTAAGTVIVKDIVVGAGGSFAVPIFSDGNQLYFWATTANEGRELWKTDGTAAGTTLLKDIAVGTASSNPQSFIKINNTLYFLATTANRDRELWKTDGTTSGTVLLKDVNTGTGSSVILEMTAVGNQLFFSAINSTNGRELWKSDGTVAGTVMVKDIHTGAIGSTPHKLVAMNGILYFVAQDGSSGRELWKSDGTAAGTVMVKDIHTGSMGSIPDDLTVWNNELYFSANDNTHGREIWKSDGTTTGTQMLKDIQRLSLSSDPNSFVVINNALFFLADDGVSGVEWWYTDGTTPQTNLLADVEPGLSSGVSNGVEVAPLGNNKMLCKISINAIGRELLITYLSNFTIKSMDIYPGTSDGVLVDAGLTIFDNKIWFVTRSYNSKMWTTDGTRPATNQFVPSNNILPIYAPRQLKQTADHLYYISQFNEIWRTDAITGNTTILNNGQNTGISAYVPLNQDTIYFNGRVNPISERIFMHVSGSNTSSVIKSVATAEEFVVANGIVYFISENSSLSAQKLWRIDGDTAIQLKVANPLVGFDSDITLLGEANQLLYFVLEDGATGKELWKTDGTIAGTNLVKDINPSGDAWISSAAVLNNELYFAADDGVNGIELWKTDGTSAGTRLVKDINLMGSSYIDELISTGSRLYFAADDGIHGKEIWTSDGTTAGTEIVKDITTGSDWSNPTQLIAGDGGIIYFSAHDGQHNGLYQTDGTTSNTKLLLQFDQTAIGFSSVEVITPWKGKVYFVAEDFHAGKELFVYDPVKQTVDIEKVSNQKDNFATLYPNPNNGQFTLEIDEPRDLNMTIFDATGRLIEQRALVNQNTVTVNLTTIANGVYFVRLQNKNKSQLIRFVKQ